MKKDGRLLSPLLAGVLFLFLWVGCNEDSEDKNDNDNTGDKTASAAYKAANMYRGGLLYDKYWKVNKVEDSTEPTETHPLYTAEGTKKGKDTWRCKECHGWDYKGKDGAYASGSHASGIAGIKNSKKTVAELVTLLKEDHGYKTVLNDTDVYDLIKFLKEGLIETTTHINEDKTSKGTAQAGKTLFDKTCKDCHGATGRDLNFAGAWYEYEFLPALATGNPWEFIHKSRFGHPGSKGHILSDGKESDPMPNAKDNEFSNEDIADILAYAQSLKSDLDAASILRGGALYDKYWKIKDVKSSAEPTGNHALYPSAGGKSGKDTWRCKECHGWDYKGKDGAYASGNSHFTGIKGIFKTAKTGQEIFDLLKNEKSTDQANGHGFAALLSDTDLWDLSLFVKSGLIDTAVYLTDKKTVGGDAAAGKTLFDKTCKDCHGADGKDLNFGHDDDPEYIKELSLGNPWETIHKIRFGHPGSEGHILKDGKESDLMPNGKDNELSLKDVLNILTYAQSLGD